MKITYEYDMGDSWMHEIVLEKITEPEKGKYYPVCIDGEKNCPPEDCGGFPGYYNLLDILKKKKGTEYKEMIEWLGEGYDPDEFDLATVNKYLKDYKGIDYGLN